MSLRVRVAQVLSPGSRGAAARQWRSLIDRKNCPVTEKQRVYLALPREWVSELFVYIGYLSRLLKTVRARLLDLIRILEHLEEDLREILAGAPTLPESPQSLEEVD